jgi:hypothetical protein
MQGTVTIPGIRLADDEFLLAVEKVGGSEHVLTNRRAISISSRGRLVDLPYDALHTCKVCGLFPDGWRRFILLGVGGGPKTVLQLIPKKGTEYQQLPLRFSIFNQKAMLRFWGNLLTWVANDALNIDDAPPVGANGELLLVPHELDLCIVGKTHYVTGMMAMAPTGVLLLTEHSLWYFEEPGIAPLGRNRIYAIIPYAAIIQSVARRYANTQTFEDELLRVLELAQLPACKRHYWAECRNVAYNISLSMGNLTFTDSSSERKVRITVRKRDSAETVQRYLERVANVHQ